MGRLTAAFSVLVTALVVLASACASGPPSPCTPGQRAAIGASYIAALEASCERGKPLAECPAYPGIHAKYEQERAGWVTCSKN